MHARWIWTTGVALAATLTLSAPAVSDENKNFVTHLTGEEQVPRVETDAQGEAIFHVSKDGTTISFKLIVANLEDVVAAHIHVAPAGENGPIVVPLENGLVPGTSNGVLAEGTFTAADLTGPLAGQSLADLLADVEAGNTYVNVHTTANPGGEIRGQID